MAKDDKEALDSAVDVVAGLAEVGIDATLESGVLRDIPLLGTVVGAVRFGHSISDHILRGKVNRFLRALPQFPEKEKARMDAEIKNDPKKCAKIGEILLLLLDRMSDLEKPDILAYAFAAYMAGDISLEQFHRLGQAIDVAYSEDLKRFGSEVRDDESAAAWYSARAHLVGAELAEITYKTENPAMQQRMQAAGDWRATPNIVELTN